MDELFPKEALDNALNSYANNYYERAIVLTSVHYYF